MVLGLLAGKHRNQNGLGLVAGSEAHFKQAAGLSVDALNDDLGVTSGTEERGLGAERDHNVTVSELATRLVLHVQGSGSFGVDSAEDQVAGLAVVADDDEVAQSNVAEGGADAVASGVLLERGLWLNEVAAGRTQCNSSGQSGSGENANLHG